MAISETAQQNHDELFPGHASTLKVTDPELIEIFDNFAFDEVLQYSEPDARTRLMVQLAALIGGRALSEYHPAWAGRRVGKPAPASASPIKVSEHSLS
jgi:4-carboxymuconolactone decarboxylase